MLFRSGRIDFVKVLFDLKEELDIANNKLKEVKENTKSLRKTLFEEMAEQYGNDENGGDFININVLPSIDKVLSIIGE